MITVHTPQNLEGARAFPFGAAELEQAVEGYLDAASCLEAAIFVTNELYQVSDFTGYEKIIQALPRLLGSALRGIDKAGAIAMDLEEGVKEPRLWYVPAVAKKPEGGAV